MNKQSYIDEVNKRLSSFYAVTNTSRGMNLGQKYRLEGFLDAGILMGLVTYKELDEIIEAKHMSILGESITERKERKRYSHKSEQFDLSR